MPPASPTVGLAACASRGTSPGAKRAPSQNAEQRVITYAEAFEELGGQAEMERCGDLISQVQAEVADDALEEELRALIPFGALHPHKRRGYSTRLVYQHYVGSLDELHDLAGSVLPAFQKAVIDLSEATPSKGRPILPALKRIERARLKGEYKYMAGGAVAWYRLTDLARASVIYHTISAMYHGALATLEFFQGRVREYNDRYLQERPSGYRDLQFVVEQDGHLCEILLSTELLALAKELGVAPRAEPEGHGFLDVPGTGGPCAPALGTVPRGDLWAPRLRRPPGAPRGGGRRRPASLRGDARVGLAAPRVGRPARLAPGGEGEVGGRWRPAARGRLQGVCGHRPRPALLRG